MNQEEIIRYITKLITIRSTADNPAALQHAVDLVEKYVQTHADVTIERFIKNGKPSFLAYKGETRPVRFDVILNAHVDVVPGSDEQFTPRNVDGKLYGRGVFDMKAAAMLETALFCEMVNKSPYTIGLQIVSDEETGGYDCVQYQIQQGVRADFVVTGEHTFAPNVIYTDQRGLLWAKVTFRGKTAHGGYPWLGDNALLRASTFAQTIVKRYPVPKEKVWGTTANIATIETTNEAYNSVPERASVKIDFRFTHDDPVFRNRENFKDFLLSIDDTIESIEIPVFDQAMSVDASNPYLQQLSDSLERVSGKATEFDRRYAGGDARHYAAVGIPAVELGLTGNDMHGVAECVDLDAISRYQETLRLFLSGPDKL